MIARAVVLGCLAWAGCGHGTKRTVIQTNAPSEYPGVLHDPKTLTQNFMVSQSLNIHTMRDGKPVDAELDAVLQKDGDTLLIIGFGPMHVKAFTLTQRGDQIEFVQFMGPQLPFSPRNIIVDVHRVYFKRLPPPSDPKYSGVQRGTLDDEQVEETWQDGQLRGSIFTRPTATASGGALKGAIRVERGPGCAPSHCEPESATLANEWFGYTLSISNEDYERL